jgi:hypothetical protein
MPDTDTREDKGAFMEAPAKADKGAFMEKPKAGAEAEAPPDSAANHTEEETAAEQARLGVHGDPWAPRSYFVDPNFRPNPLDVGSLVTTEHAGNSSYDVQGLSGLFSNAGVQPASLEENIPPSPEPPPPMGATDYQPNPSAVAAPEDTSQEESEDAHAARAQLEASAAQATEYNADPKNVPASVSGEAPAVQTPLQAAHAKTIARVQAEQANKGEVQDKAEKTVEAAQETVEAAKATPAPAKAQGASKAAPAKAQGATKAPPAPNPGARTVAPPAPPGTKDTALETHVSDAEAGGSTSS